jgi:Gpi18-like mannosyltransferase
MNTFHLQKPLHYWKLLEYRWKNTKLHDEFIENTITNFYIPLGVVSNFLINGKYSTIPMAIEESLLLPPLLSLQTIGLLEVVLKRQ